MIDLTDFQIFTYSILLATSVVGLASMLDDTTRNGWKRLVVYATLVFGGYWLFDFLFTEQRDFEQTKAQESVQER